MDGNAGRLILVVGPSGAGKDTLIRHARDRLRDDPRFVFPRRIVTRPRSDSEDNIEVDVQTFLALRQAGEFFAWWDAHGLHYGLPSGLETDLASGRSVICNVSRTVINALRARFSRTLVIEVTAAPEILARRLADRGRVLDGDPSRRVARSVAFQGRGVADLSIRNEGVLEDACSRFLSAITRASLGEGPEHLHV